MTNATIYIEDIANRPKIVIFSPNKKILGLQFECEYTSSYNSSEVDVEGISIWNAQGSHTTGGGLTNKIIISHPDTQNLLDFGLTLEQVAKRGRFAVCILPAPIDTGTLLTNIKMVYLDEDNPTDFTKLISNVTVRTGSFFDSDNIADARDESKNLFDNLKNGNATEQQIGNIGKNLLLLASGDTSSVDTSVATIDDDYTPTEILSGPLKDKTPKKINFTSDYKLKNKSQKDFYRVFDNIPDPFVMSTDDISSNVIPSTFSKPNVLFFNKPGSETIELTDYVKPDTGVYINFNENDPAVKINLGSPAEHKILTIECTGIHSETDTEINRKFKVSYGGLNDESVITGARRRYNGKTVTFGSIIISGDDEGTDVAESGADPYVSPIYGPTYKLPSRKAFYRFFGDSKSSFVVNAQVDKLPISASLDIQSFSKPLINNINHSDRVKKNLTDDGFYYRNFFIKNKNNKFVLDLENLLVIKGNQKFSLVEEQTLNLNNVKINVDNKFGHEKIIYPYPPNEILKTITLETNTEKFGKVVMEFSIFVCPQIRNGVKINVSKPITKENSNGLLVCYQKTKSIKIPRLTYTKKMNSVVEKLERKLVTEEFRDYSQSGELINKRKITFICA